jgi:hypothetical protein
VIKSKRFRQQYLNNKHDYLLDSNIVLSSLKHKILENGKQDPTLRDIRRTGFYFEVRMADTILLWEIWNKQDPTLRDTWRIEFYFQEYAESRILLWDVCDEQNITVKDLWQKWFYF